MLELKSHVQIQMKYIGIQESPRKINDAYQRKGTWVWTIIHMAYFMEGMIPQDKWSKLKDIIE